MLSGRISFESLGGYCASKAAIESYSDTLRLEMRKWGVKVLSVQPAGFQTGEWSVKVLSVQPAGFQTGG